MKKLKIAQVAPLWFSIPPKSYGGSERIIHLLTEGLVQKGHRVWLFASGDSKTKAKLVPVIKKHLCADPFFSTQITWKEYVWNAFNTALAIERSKNFDIVHTHWSWVPFLFCKFSKSPLVHTFHNIPSFNDTRWKVLNYYKNQINAVFISRSEQKNSQVHFKKEWVIYNGIDISQFKLNLKPENYFLWVGKIVPFKGLKEAIWLVKKAKERLLIAGNTIPEYYNFFQKEIKPHFSKKIVYLGELSQKELVEVYGKAKALLYPISWEEPFGLVMVEAMACGTPVIAFNRGSVPEIVQNGKTGFVVKNLKEMLSAMKKIRNISRLFCRQWVERKFNSQEMVEKYEKIYYEILRK